jgi:hypothetical protein
MRRRRLGLAQMTGDVVTGEDLLDRRLLGVAQRSKASGQRVRNRQPEGGSIGLGTSPFRMIRLRSISGSGTGTADNSASV